VIRDGGRRSWEGRHQRAGLTRRGDSIDNNFRNFGKPLFFHGENDSRSKNGGGHFEHRSKRQRIKEVVGLEEDVTSVDNSAEDGLDTFENKRRSLELLL